MSVFKYTRTEFVRRFLAGQVLLRPLSYYQQYEDQEAVGDPLEATRRLKPPEGLIVHNQTQGRLQVVRAAFDSSGLANQIRVFCTSTQLSTELASRFNADACMEIFDVDEFARRLESAARIMSPDLSLRLVHRKIRYYDEGEAPGIDWALPERLALSKTLSFGYQFEYRFALAPDYAWELGATSQRLTFGEGIPLPRRKNTDRTTVNVGNLRDLCKVASLVGA